MPKLHVAASVTSPPTDVALKLNSHNIKMARDGSGNWTGSADLELPNTIPLEFRAVGIPTSAWTLTIKLTTPPPDNKDVKDYKHDDVIPDNGLSVLEDTITL